MAEIKGFVTAILCYANACKFNDRFSHFPRGFCVIHARWSVCPCLDLGLAYGGRPLPPPRRAGQQRGSRAAGGARVLRRAAPNGVAEGHRGSAACGVTAGDTDACCWQTMPCTPRSRGCRPPSRTAPPGPRLIGTTLSCPAALCACSSRVSWPRLHLTTRHGSRVCRMAGAASEGTAWTNRSARAMMPAVRHEAMLPQRGLASNVRGRPLVSRQRLSHSLDRRQTMSELDARYARGQDTRRLFGGGTITRH